MSVPWNELYWCGGCRMYLDDTETERAGEANIWHYLDDGTTCGPVKRLDSPEEAYERGLRAALEEIGSVKVPTEFDEMRDGVDAAYRAVERLLEDKGDDDE